MKRYLIQILIISVLASVVLVGCGRERGALSEQQVIQMTYDYLTTRAEQLTGVEAELKEIEISWAFSNALTRALNEIDRDKLGDLVYMQLSRPLPGTTTSLRTITWTGLLKKLAKYQGDGLWSVSIDDWEWEFNERTGEVIAQNEEAVNLLEEITLKTYHNTRYGYYLDYPPSWTINDEDKSKVWIFPGSSEEGEVFVYIHVIEKVELAPFEGLQGYMVEKLSLLQSLCHEFELIEATTSSIHYIYRLLSDSPKHEAKRYYVEYGSEVYEIVSSGAYAYDEYYSFSLLYDPFDSFRFQP